MTIRPIVHLTDIAKRYPDIWRSVDHFRAGRGQDLPNWPEWCFLPIAAGMAIASHGAPDPRLITLDHSTDASIIAGLAAWRVTQGVYRFDEDLLAALWDTPLSGDLPTDLFERLPEWAVYIETPGKTWLGKPMLGYFAHLEWDVNTGGHELRLLIDEGKGLLSLAIHLLPNSNLLQSVEAAIREGQHQSRIRGIPAPVGEDVIQAIAGSIAPMVSVLLYLCSEEPDIVDERGTNRQPGKPLVKKTKVGPRIFPPDQPSVWETGFRLGDAIRHAQGEANQRSGTGSAPRPHIRRAHWHGYWTGPKSGQQRMILKWIHPILVGIEREEDVHPTIRRVKQ